jgi:hypothetical protein
MHFIGIDLHTNRFTCCYRTERSSLTNGQDKRTETFDLTGPGGFLPDPDGGHVCVD